MTDHTLQIMRAVESGAIAPEAAAELVRTLGQTEPAAEPQPPATPEQPEAEQLDPMERMKRAYSEAA